MARSFTCSCCRRILPANPRCKDQEYCGEAPCQRERKRRWQALKMATDPDYRQNQREAFQSWCERNPEYWRQRRQKKRSKAAGLPASEKSGRANGDVKMDTLRHDSQRDFHVKSGEYLLVPTGVKMDALRVKIIVVPP